MPSAPTKTLQQTMAPVAHMRTDSRPQGLIDTSILILRAWLAPTELPVEMAISSVTLAELSAGPHEVRSNSEQHSYDERARRMEILQRAESEFDPIPFDAEAAPRRLQGPGAIARHRGRGPSDPSA
ncbi:hypothetical protein GCM10022223_38390 [Kineosporia mesophila]|uniref:Uncharacterized protein n=1 Tax=Kineosporia mesophila TaxID=566012 RepID=A0ABP6ZVH5_9ACTN